jgi:hypothetical protein
MRLRNKTTGKELEVCSECYPFLDHPEQLEVVDPDDTGPCIFRCDDQPTEPKPYDV